MAEADLNVCAQLAHNRLAYYLEFVMTTLTKDTRLHIRCDQDMRRLLDKAAAYAHMSAINVKPGQLVRQGQVIGKVVEVDEQYEEIVIDSEGSKLRFGFNAISREYVRPAYVHDDEVDENGNPLSKEDEPDQKPIVDATEEPAQDADVIQQPIDEQKND